MNEKNKALALLLSIVFLLSSCLFFGFKDIEISEAEKQMELPEAKPKEILIYSESSSYDAKDEIETIIDEANNMEEGLTDKEASTIEDTLTAEKNEAGGTVAVAELPGSLDVKDAVDILSNTEAVKDKDVIVQPNYIYRLADSEAYEMPDIPKSAINWHIHKVNGFSANKFAKENGKNNKKIRVGVIDSGANINHPLLRNVVNKNLSIRYNPRYTKLKGDENGHGTHVSGLIAGDMNSKKTWSGIAAGLVDLVVVDASDHYSKDAYFSTYDMIKGLDYLYAKKCRIVNMSISGNGRDLAMERCINRLYKKGLLVIAAAGNDANKKFHFPGDFNNVISVINIDKDDYKAYDSNFGPGKTLSAPGFNVYSTYRGKRLYSMSGTSMASPIITGTIALMLYVDPSLTNEEIKLILRSSATDINKEGYDEETAFGLVNAQKAVELTKNRSNYGHVEKIILDRKSIKCDPARKIQLQYGFVLGDNNFGLPKVTWSSSEKNIAVVDQNGLVTAKRPGKAVIYCSADNYQAKCHIRVMDVYHNYFSTLPYNSVITYKKNGYKSYDMENGYYGIRMSCVKGKKVSFLIDVLSKYGVLDINILDRYGNSNKNGKSDSKYKFKYLDSGIACEFIPEYTGDYFIQILNFSKEKKLNIKYISYLNHTDITGKRSDTYDKVVNGKNAACHKNILKWVPVANVDGYELYRKSKKGSWQKLRFIKQPNIMMFEEGDVGLDNKGTIIGEKEIIYIDKDILNNREFYYRVKPAMMDKAKKYFMKGKNSNAIFI